MDMSFTKEQIAFRQEVRDWIKSAMPAELREKAEVDGNFDQREVMEWHKILASQGLGRRRTGRWSTAAPVSTPRRASS